MANASDHTSDNLAAKPSTRVLTTTVVGSWPKPSWLSSDEHDTSGWAVDRQWQFRDEELRQKQDEATEWALREQEATGVDVVSDGEERRDNYVYYFCRRLDGFDFEYRTRIVGRSGAWEWPAPRITGPIISRRNYLPDDYSFVRKRTNRRVKMTIPGPMTIVDSVQDEYYGDEAALAFDIAKAIRQEVAALAAIGCDFIQFDEPAFSRYPQKMSDYGMRALEECFEGIPNITTAVHVCRGYPIEGYTRAGLDGYHLIAPMLADSKVAQISIEGTDRLLDLKILEKFGEKVVIFGVLDVGDTEIEGVDEIERRIMQALEHVGPDRLSPAPNCGMVLLTTDVAKAKLKNLVVAADRVRESLTSSAT